MGISRSRSRVGARRRRPLLPRQSSGAAASSGCCCSASTSVRSARDGQAPTPPPARVSSPAADSRRTSGGPRSPAAPTMGAVPASPAAGVAPAHLPPPSARGLAAASLASRKADPTMQGRLVSREVPSTPESPASSKLVLATPTPTASPVVAAGDSGHVTGPSSDLRAGKLLAASGASDALAAGMVQSLWSSLDDDDDDKDDEDGVELAPQSPLPTKCSSGVSTEHEAATCVGWQEVRPRHGSHRLASRAPASSPRPIPAWLHGRCCRCLVSGHRAAKCRDPFRCSHCLGNGHRARECRNAWRPLSLLDNPTASSLSRLDSIHHLHPSSCQAHSNAMLPSKAIQRDSWASVVSSTAGSAASADVALQSVFTAQAELLRSELQGMASLQMVKAIQPLSDVVDSMHGWLLRAGSLLERAEVALGRLSPATAEAPLPPMSPPLPKLVVDFEGDNDVDLYGCFSPRASGFSPRVGSSLTPQVLPDFEGVASVEVVSPVLQIMPELQMLSGELVSPLSMEQLKLDSPQASEVDLVSSPPPMETCQASNSLPLDVMESGVLDAAVVPSSMIIGQVMPVSGMTTEPLVLAPTPDSNALFAKELCDLLASVEVARPGLGRSIACLLTGTPIRDKQKKVGNRKSGAKGKTSLAA
ncbi:hypothetical protein ACQJBY_029825 [Aegilops geniculata]